MNIELKSGQLHVWLTDTASNQPPISELSRILSPDEQERAARFRFPVHRDRYVVAHASLRLLLGSYLGVPPSGIVFSYTPLGKPFLSLQQTSKTLSADDQLAFNLSHSADLAVFAFARTRHVGVDIEFINLDIDIYEIAPTVFTASELAKLQAVPTHQQRPFFFDLWSRKEAYAKALGMGMQLPFHQLEVGGRPLIDGLRVQSFKPSPGYAGAVAAPEGFEEAQHFQFRIADFWKPSPLRDDECNG